MTADWRTLRERILILEDDQFLAINKPPGLSVMGERHAQDILAMASGAGEALKWVHRIDKVTSGVVLLAKTAAAHAALTRQFARQTVDKAYLAICGPGGLPAKGTIDLPLTTAGSGKVRVAAERDRIRRDPAAGTWSVDPTDLIARKSYPSRTDYVTLWDGGEAALVLALPQTGRRHQIRVHLAWAGHAILGDPLFLKAASPASARTYLHAWRLCFDSPGGGGRVRVEASPDVDFWAPIAARLSASCGDLLETARAALPSGKGI